MKSILSKLLENVFCFTYRSSSVLPGVPFEYSNGKASEILNLAVFYCFLKFVCYCIVYYGGRLIGGLIDSRKIEEVIVIK